MGTLKGRDVLSLADLSGAEVQQIAEGGQAKIYRATDKKTNRTVVVKEFKTRTASPQELTELLRQFNETASLLQKPRSSKYCQTV